MKNWLHILLVLLCHLSYGQDTNPFDIIRSASDSAEVKVLEDKDEAITSTKLESENPFTVSHIPIRKNQLQEIERLSMNSKVAEEDISLLSLPLWIIIFSLILLAFILYQKKDYLTILIRSLASENFMRMTTYEERGGFSLTYVLGYVIFLLNIALFLYQLCIQYFNLPSEILRSQFLGKPLYPYILLGCFVFFVGKHLANIFFSWVFNLDREARLYDFTIISIYNLLSVIFIFLNILIIFGPSSWIRTIAILGVGIFIIFLLSRHYKGIRIGGYQLNNYFFHFFLYFCAFEISPWVVVYTFIKDFI